MKKVAKNLYIIVTLCTLLSLATQGAAQKHYSATRKLELREDVRRMFQHAYDGYLRYAGNYDELRPLTCDGQDTWGSYSLTLIDALDTLATMGNFSEFRRVHTLLVEKMNFNRDINVSVFETNIRIVGGLLSAHLLSRRAGIDVEPGWPCTGPLLRMAEDVARRLLPAFDTSTGMPYGTVNLRYGVPSGETPITCTAGVGTFLVEFGTLSRLTGNSIYEEVALQAIYALWERRSPIGLFGNHIDVQSGRWTAIDSGIGAGVDSLFEYLVKGAILLNRPELMELFAEARAPIDKYMRKEDWYVWVGMNKGHVTLPVFQSLESFWPGILSIVGDTEPALRTMMRYISVWKKYGFLPEFFNIPAGEASPNREVYPLRPELIESAMYLYRSTKNQYLLELGEHMLETIEFSAKTRCGYATIRNVVTHEKENRMESFFLAETTKYLYLLFDENNFLHNDGDDRHGELLDTEENVCVVQAGAYIFNTEAHPMDMSAVHCCHNYKEDIFAQLDVSSFTGKALFEHSRKQRVAAQENWKPDCHPSKDTASFAASFEQSTSNTNEPERDRDKGRSAQATPSFTTAVDIEVFDEYQQPAADMLVKYFERIREERELNRTQQNLAVARNQLTVSDLDEFFGQRRESFASVEDTLQFVLNFMSNFTMDVAFIRGLQLYDGNISTVLGVAAQKDYESKMRSLWQLYVLEQQLTINVQLIRRLGLDIVPPPIDGDMLRNFLAIILENLNQSLDELQTLPANSTLNQTLNSSDVQLIRNAIDVARIDYVLAMRNTTAMQEFVHRIYLHGTNEEQATQQFLPLLSVAELGKLLTTPLKPAEEQELFKYTRRIVDFRKRMSETVDRLQTIMQDLGTTNTDSTSPPTTSGNPSPVPVAMPPVAISETATAKHHRHRQRQQPHQPQQPPQAQLQDQDNQQAKAPDVGSVWSQFVQNILRKTTVQRVKFDESVLLEKTRKALEKHAHKQLSYELFSCRRPQYIESFAYRDYYPEAM
ncbi:ER degradation-enhancing alpha-mannosidase-like protein 2 [Drosophila grimshawi]|uniref:alpha-1,2-Mannosidase n=1 Tax=Drosophila grimshawi TaxID=7222 RepID=B4JWY0_DROGR|nr:ER degradation-enhancing alpha-mannosidase-like protein 2 [Drosophila grimshawi]EDV95256.1 GH17843 [Drosophila grimshawi]